MVAKKLPSYDELKRLFLEEDLSYSAIALRYNCHHDTVYQKLKSNAARRGDPWPFTTNNHSAKITKGLKETTISAEGVSYILDERYREDRAARQAITPGEIVHVPKMGLDKTTPKTRIGWSKDENGVPFISERTAIWPRRTAIYHRDDCYYAQNYDCVQMPLEEAEEWAFARCSMCFDLSKTEWARRHGWTNASYIIKIMEGSWERVRIQSARQIMKALGESIPKSLNTWQPRSQMWDKRKWEKRKKKRAA